MGTVSLVHPLLLLILLITRSIIMIMMFQFIIICPWTASSSSSSSSSSMVSIQELLRKSGLPGGLFPKGVKSYSVSEGGVLEVVLEGPCLTKFDTTSFYESVVRANLTYGGLTGVEGLSQEELFLWVPVKDIILDNPRSGLILFDIGLAHKQLSLSLFEDPPHCNTNTNTNNIYIPPTAAGCNLKRRRRRNKKGFAQER